MRKGYQNNYSLIQNDAVHNITGRTKKALTTLKILQDYFNNKTDSLVVLDIGASTGIIDNFLADHFHSITGVDIDEPAIQYAKTSFSKENLQFKIADAMNIDEPDAHFDIILCSHVYEHVPDQKKLMNEIYRLLKPHGICYFSAGNRLNIMEPHYRLPFLSIMPHFFAHIYLRLLGRGKYYYEEHKTLWGLRKLVTKFKLHDYTHKLIDHPDDFEVSYMLPAGSFKTGFARFISRYCYWLMPGYIWLLEKK